MRKRIGVLKRCLTGVLAVSMIATAMVGLTGCGKGSEEKSITLEEAPVPEVSRVQANWAKDAVLYEVNVRQYTEEGTFDAFSQHLERLKKMGVNTLWFMPIFPISEKERKGTLGSYYSIKDYYEVNPEFGSKEDFIALVNKAHDMGFHVILDWVANHTGWDNTWITEHPEYYLKDDSGNIIYPVDTDWTDVAQLDFSNPDMRKAMIDVMSYWVKEVGVDGFRCDYAQGVPQDFWEEARAALDQIKPVYMLAEDGTQSAGLLNKAFDSNYAFAVYDMLELAGTGSVDTSALKYQLEAELPEGAFKMNFLDNHDKNSYEGTMEKRYGAQSIGALTSLIFTMPGMPIIYSGQEEDIDYELAFTEKDCINFGDYKYEELFTILSHIKANYDALNNDYSGGSLTIHESDNKKVLAFSRTRDGLSITFVGNLSNKEQEVSYMNGVATGKVLLHGDANGIIENVEIKEDGSLNTENLGKAKKNNLTKLGAWEYYVIVSE